MKGPYLRIRPDLRRVWECPDCHHIVRTSGWVTSQFCKCDSQSPAGRPMRLVFDGETRTPRPRPAAPEETQSE